MSKFADAQVCVNKVFSPEGCQYHWLETLFLFIKAGVTYESLKITPEQVKNKNADICLAHAKLWYRVICADMKHNYDVTGEIALMKKWLAKGGLSYDRLGATADEIVIFNQIAQQNSVEP